MPDVSLIPVVNTIAPTLSPAATTKTYIQASAFGAAAVVTATLPAAVGKTTWLSGFWVTGAGATAATTVQGSITGIGTQMFFYVTVPAGVNSNVAELFVEFADPIPASGTNTAIVISVPSFGAGNTSSNVTAHGFQQ